MAGSKVRQTGERLHGVMLDGPSASAETPRIQPSSVAGGSRKRMRTSADHGDGGNDDHSDGGTDVTQWMANFPRDLSSTSGVVERAEKRQRTASEAVKSVETNVGRPHDALVTASVETPSKESWRWVMDLAYWDIVKLHDEIAGAVHAAQHGVCFVSSETEFAALMPKIDWLLDKGRKYTGTEKGAYALDKADEAMRGVLNWVLSYRHDSDGWPQPDCTTCTPGNPETNPHEFEFAEKLTLATSGLDLQASERIDATLSSLMEIRLLYYPLGRFEGLHNVCDIESWAN
jgi:hypothetical protein